MSGLPSKVLVANRGEIAVRIISTLRRLGIASVAIHHAVDAGSRAVRDADEAVQLFGDPPVAAYLDVDQIVAACRATGAEAVHPGFGFLSENAGFAEALIEAGIVWIGPPPSAIRSLGDKIESKRLALEAGVPILPGSAGAVRDADEAVTESEAIGFPVLLKAAAGGGGKGMRIAENAAECCVAFERASAEAKAAFGDGRMFVERYVARPRHIEIQVLADHHGNVIHLGDRECSIQRRHQKVIEEAPSPLLDDDQRSELGTLAVGLARSVGYTSAGTVEMIADGEGGFFFLEMNTRLQVEHPVTEMITGIDIVAEQIRVASGEPLGITQSDVMLTGHSIEARIYAEDPWNDFRPQTGTAELVRWPHDPGVRIDHGLREGDPVTASFDPMLAKVVTHGPDRAAALARAIEALRETVVLGVTTNTAYLRAVLEHPAFAAADLHTGFLTEHADALADAGPSDEQLPALIAAALLFAHHDPRHDPPAALDAIGPWRP